MKYQENIEKMFIDDIREKKRTGTGAFHMRGKGVKHGSNKALRTPSFFMKAKEKKKLDGEVVTFNMNQVLHKKEFETKDFETQKMLLTNWRNLYDNQTIMDEMGLSSKSQFHNLIKQLDIPKKSRWDRKGGKPRKAKAIVTAAIHPEEVNEQIVATLIKPTLEEKVIRTLSEPFTVLATKTMKEFDISVVILNRDLLNGFRKFYAFRMGMLYDPEREFKPNAVGSHKLPDELKEIYYSLLEIAVEQHDKIKGDYLKETPIIKKEIVKQEENILMKFTGIYDAEHINKILTKAQILIDGEENKFRLRISLVECTE